MLTTKPSRQECRSQYDFESLVLQFIPDDTDRASVVVGSANEKTAIKKSKMILLEKQKNKKNINFFS
jgi:hypothetical protein